MLNTKTVQVFRLYGNDNSRGSLLGLDKPCLVDIYQCFRGTWCRFCRICF